MDNQQALSKEEQLLIIQEVERDYAKFLDPSFDASIFLKCRDNFALTAHIESVKIFAMDNPPINPKFTIAIPTYNRCETLKEAIDSALSQDTDEHYEIIVVENVDDFNIKTPAQEMLEREYRGKLTYYKNRENIGLFQNWNRCLTLAQGEWVCLLHSDDTITSNYIQEMKKIINTSKYCDAILVGCYDAQFPVGGKYAKIISWLYGNSDVDDRYYDFPTKNLGSATAILHHRDRSIQIGGYNPDEYPSSDYFFHYRAFQNGKILFYHKALKKTRIHSGRDSNSTGVALAFLILHVKFVLFTHTLHPPLWCVKNLAYEDFLHVKQAFFMKNSLISIFAHNYIKSAGITRRNKPVLKCSRLLYLFILFIQFFKKSITS